MLKTFAYHKPSEAGLAKIAALREAFSTVHAAIEANAPSSRERAVALTNLETTAMWAVKAVVFNDPESEVAMWAVKAVVFNDPESEVATE